MQITLTFEKNATPETIAHQLRMQAGIFEGLTPKQASARTNTAAGTIGADEDTESEDEDDDAPVAKKTTGKKAAAAYEDDDADEEEAPKAKKGKSKKITMDQLNDAVKTFAKAQTGKTGIVKARKLLMKNFDTESLSEIDEDQWQDVLDLFAVED